MTLVVSVKVNDGVVLAADSASSLLSRDTSGALSVSNVYNNANKIFNLYKTARIGGITWGAGGIGESSIYTLAKDFRSIISDRTNPSTYIDRDKHSIEEVAERFLAFMDEAYQRAYHSAKPPGTETGFLVAGFSSDGHTAEQYVLGVGPSGPIGPEPLPASGLWANGQPEPVYRLVMGTSSSLGAVLEHDLGVDPSEVGGVIDTIARASRVELVHPAMPIQDAIELAEFLVHTTIQYIRFASGAQTVGGPIEIAAITKHEGFKWVRRKYWFDRAVNPD